jgi:murein DD-endopeptidase MepM/ murein hydrolase activator NlpD
LLLKKQNRKLFFQLYAFKKKLKNDFFTIFNVILICIMMSSAKTLAQSRQLPIISFQIYPELNSFLVLLNQHNEIFTNKVKKNSSLYTELLQHGFSGKDINEIQKSSLPYFNLTKLSPNTPYRFLYDTVPIVKWSGIEFKLSNQKYLTLSKTDNTRLPAGAEVDSAKINSITTWHAQLTQLKFKTKITSFTGIVTSSLWKSAEQALMDSKLIADLTEIFAWQIDFSRQVNENDSWRLVVEEQIINNQHAGWGKILAAEYNNGSTIYEGYYYENLGYVGYFAKDGKSSARTLLRTPIEFARITSGFSFKRFHPQLKIIRPHLGVDYAAPKGTPIRSVGDGKITEARYTLTGGSTLTIEHNSVYKTRYLHLNGFATNIVTGKYVKQGQIIGYVGSTGLSTGPHLHFEFYENNNYKDPLKVNLPPAKSIPPQLMSDFQKSASQWIAMLPSWPREIASLNMGRNKQ